MNLYVISLFIGCSGCNPKPVEQPAVLEEENLPPDHQREEARDEAVLPLDQPGDRAHGVRDRTDPRGESLHVLVEELELERLVGR